MPIPHHVLQRRRRGGTVAEPPRAPAEEEKPEPPEEPEESGAAKTAEPERAEKAERAGKEPAPGLLARVRVLVGRPVVIGLATVLLGGFAAWAATRAGDLRDGPVAGNVALTDTARTSEVKGQITDAVNELFSYNYTDMARTERAAKRLLTGKAVQQYDTMLAQVRQEAPKQKLVLTTTVTDSGVTFLDDDQARLLLYADQRNTRTTEKETTYAAAMLAVDAVRVGDTWKIAHIDTLTVRK